MPICRLAAPGWENFTGSLGHGAVFKDGVSVEPLNPRQIARIGSSTILVNEETGEQVGPSVIHHFIQHQEFEVQEQLSTAKDEAEKEEIDRKKLEEEELARRAAEKEAFEAAQKKAMEQVANAVVYTRAELEAIASNNGIQGLRDIAAPLGVKGRSISELVTEILAAQAKLAAQ